MTPPGRRSARRQAVFVLYQLDLLNISALAALARGTHTELDAYSRHLIIGVAENKQEIDDRLAPRLANWSLERLGVLERSILRLAAYELLWEEDVPAAVAINEAVTLARKFCSDEAGALINGVLGSLQTPEGACHEGPQTAGDVGEHSSDG